MLPSSNSIAIGVINNRNEPSIQVTTSPISYSFEFSRSVYLVVPISAVMIFEEELFTFPYDEVCYYIGLYHATKKHFKNKKSQCI